MQLNTPVKKEVLKRQYEGYKFILIQSKTLIQKENEKAVIVEYYITRNGETVWDSDRNYTELAAKRDFFTLLPTLLPPPST